MGQRTIWGMWNCAQCSTTKISAEPLPGEDQPKCPHCGSPREPGVEEPYLPNARDPVTGKVLDANVADTKEELDIANAGPDWNCHACGGNNRARVMICVGCGQARMSEPAREPITAESLVRAMRRVEEAKLSLLEARGLLVASRGPVKVVATGVKTAPHDHDFDHEIATIHRRELCKKTLVASLVIGAILAIASLIAWGCSTHELQGTVLHATWKHSIDQERFTKVTDSNWADSISVRDPIMPVNGHGERPGVFDVRGCHAKHHHDRQYQCGTDHRCYPRTRQVPNGTRTTESCHTSSNGNGSFREVCTPSTTTVYRSESYEECREEPRYCSEPIYETWCMYSTYQWKLVDTFDTHGTDPTNFPLGWPSINAGPLDRLTRSESYQAEIGVKDWKTTQRLSSEDDLRRWTPGAKVVVTQYNLGAVKGSRLEGDPR